MVVQTVKNISHVFSFGTLKIAKSELHIHVETNPKCMNWKHLKKRLHIISISRRNSGQSLP